jgi:primosomal protein N' (replication factor Y)
MSRIFLKILVPGPFADGLTYHATDPVKAGIRVRVPLGAREVVGLCCGPSAPADDVETTRSIIEVLDTQPIVDPALFQLAAFASDYYLAPQGDVLLQGIPTALRKGKVLPRPQPEHGRSVARTYPLTAEQRTAVDQVENACDRFAVFLLQGVTGSGKTQVFSELIAHTLARKQQVLLLVPEIGLTGQMVERIKTQLTGTLNVSHSGLADGARARAYAGALSGDTDVLIGTRSALFTPLPNLGLILIDEEHDSAYKNQDGVRFSARDLAIVRAKHAAIPILLASATPALETWHHANCGRYTRLRLTHRPGAANKVSFHLVDARRDPAVDGLTQTARHAIHRTLSDGHQALIFLNRRGYAPVLLCTRCGWTPSCRHCDARPTLHRTPDRLWCHHCDHKQRPPAACPDCGEKQLMPIGQGTERLSEALTQEFPDWPVIRIDRDTTTRRRAFETLLEPVLAGDPCILIGTQMLAKGHDFSQLATVVVADADQGLLGADFRAVEHFAQLLTQVAGRAGRHQAQGEVLIQTHQPESAWFSRIMSGDYDALAAHIHEERTRYQWPPETHLALVTARGPANEPVMQALDGIAQHIQQLQSPIRMLGPAPAPMERRNRQFHGQLLLVGARTMLNWVLRETGPWAYRRHGRVMLQLDVDPWDLW